MTYKMAADEHIKRQCKMVAVYHVVCHKMAVDCYMVGDHKMVATLHVTYSKVASKGHIVWQLNAIWFTRWLRDTRSNVVSRGGK